MYGQQLRLNDKALFALPLTIPTQPHTVFGACLADTPTDRSNALTDLLHDRVELPGQELVVGVHLPVYAQAGGLGGAVETDIGHHLVSCFSCNGTHLEKCINLNQS